MCVCVVEEGEPAREWSDGGEGEGVGAGGHKGKSEHFLHHFFLYDREATEESELPARANGAKKNGGLKKKTSIVLPQKKHKETTGESSNFRIPYIPTFSFQ